MKIRTNYTFNSNSLSFVFVLLQCFGMLQVRKNEKSLRKWSGGTAHLRTFRGSIGCKKCALLAAMLLYT